jgi:hypothetical protein
MLIQGDQEDGTAYCRCGGVAGRGAKEGPPGAPYYVDAASRAYCGGHAGCCYEGRIPGHIEMVPVHGL